MDLELSLNNIEKKEEKEIHTKKVVHTDFLEIFVSVLLYMFLAIFGLFICCLCTLHYFCNYTMREEERVHVE